MKLHSYLLFDACCAQAFKYYEQHLNAKIVELGTYGEMPNAPAMPPEQAKSVLHARLELGETVLMASDAAPGLFQPMNGVYLALSAPSDAEGERIYAALSDGGQVTTPLQEMFFATRFAQLRDKFGILWMIIHECPMP